MIDDVKLGSRGGNVAMCDVSDSNALPSWVHRREQFESNTIVGEFKESIAIVVAINRLATSSGSLLAHDWPRLLAVLYDGVERPSLWRETR